jgi:creatinine amidohydrolase
MTLILVNQVQIMSKLLLWDMTYEEARAAFEEADFVVLPTGSIEQHSIHLPVSVDSIRAEELTRYLVENSGGLKMIMLPTLVYGQSLHHIRFPGTVTLTEETYMNVIKDIAWSVKQHGAKRLLIVNYHGGNVAPIEVTRLVIERERGLKVYLVKWSEYASETVKAWAPGVDYGHSGFYETSMILKFRPDLVQKDKYKVQETRHDSKMMGGRTPTRAPSAAYFDDNYITGGIGDPSLSSVELADKVIPMATEKIVEALKEDMRRE